MNENELKNFLKKPISYARQLDEDQLADLISFLNDKYYNGQGIVSDTIYEKISEILREMNPDHEIFDRVGAVVRDVSDDESEEESEGGKKKKVIIEDVTLPYFMGSLDKVKNSESKKLQKWMNNYSTNFVLSPKLDGASVLIIYRNGKISIYTRGDGDVGRDVSHLQKYIKLPKLDVNCAIRGEFIISNKNWLTIAEEAQRNSTGIANPRNTVSGTIGSKTLDDKFKRFIKTVDIVVYEVVDYSEPMTVEQQFQFLEKNGFNTVKYWIKSQEEITVDYLEDEYLRLIGTDTKLGTFPYGIDGIVLVANDFHERTRTKKPKYAIAYKARDEIKNVTVTEVTWKVSKDGYLKPTVHFAPIILDGAKNSKATGHNAGMIWRNKIGKGAIISIQRSNKVIPFIVEVVEGSTPSMPVIPYKWNETEVDIFIDPDFMSDGESLNSNESADTSEKQGFTELVKIANIIHFFKKLGVENFGEALIRRVYDDGLKSVGKIIHANVKRLMKVDGFKITLATKIYNNIQNALNNASLSEIMASTNVFGRGFGRKRLDIIVNAIPDILTIDENSVEEKVMELDGFSTKTAGQFAEKLPAFKKFCEENDIDIKKFIENTEEEKDDGMGKFDAKKGSAKPSDLVYVFSGFRDKNLERCIISAGGRVTTSISKKTTKLIIKDESSSGGKIDKARELGIEVVTLKNFIKNLGK